MLFTTQQLQGGPRYAHKTRIGNWKEDLELEEAQFKDYMSKRETGVLTVHQIENKLYKLLQPSGHSYSRDGFVHFDDKLMLLSKNTKSYLVCDIWDRIPGGDEAYAVTASPKVNSPVRRAVFVLTKMENEKNQDDILRYGQQFRLAIHPTLMPKQFFLHSCPISPLHFARFSRYQEVCVVGKAIYNTVWTCEHIDVQQRFEMQGEPVLANEPVLIKHNATGHWLAADFLAYPNDFGQEWEVSVHSFISNKKTQQLSSEKAGKLTTDIPSRLIQEHNVWMFCTSSDPSAEEELPDIQVRTFDDVMKQIKDQLMQKGAFGVRGLARIFKNMDENSNKTLDKEDFKWGLYNYGIYLEDQEIVLLIEKFDRNKDGVVNFEEFLVGLRGGLNPYREKFVKQAYQKLDKNGDGQVTLEDIALIYNATQHPDVQSGKKTEEQIFKEFMSMWDTQQADGIITLDEFKQYYGDVSSNIESDEFFAEMMRSAWKL